MGKSLRAIVIAAIGMGMTLGACEVVAASPKWRLRRWSNRAPIDPTIRSTVSFKNSRASSYGQRHASPQVVWRSAR